MGTQMAGTEQSGESPILAAARLLEPLKDKGFDAVDWPVAKFILKTPAPTSRQINCLWRILRKYQAQLKDRGIDFTTLVPPTLAPVGAPPAEKRPEVKLYFVKVGRFRRLAAAFNQDTPIREVANTLMEGFNANTPQSFFDEGSRLWVYPSDVESVRSVISAFESITPPVDVTASKIIREFIQESEKAYEESRAETADIEIPTKLPLYPFQRAGVKWIVDHDGRALVADEMGLGKAQPIDSKILTPSGWCRIGDAVVGMEVFGSDGLPHKIIGVFPQGKKEIFKVNFSDGATVECCDDHLWAVNSALRKWQGYESRILSLREIRKRLFNPSGNSRYFIPMVSPLRFPRRDLPLDPYLLGALLGDGSLKKIISFSTADPDLAVLVTAALPVGVRLYKKSHRYNYDVVWKSGVKNPVKKVIEDLGIGVCAEEKFIPEVYKFSDVDQRIALLQGLMDTDGYVSKDGMVVQFGTSSPRLCDDVRFLIESLGGKATRAEKIPTYVYKGKKHFGLRAFTLTMSLPSTVCPFRLPRKKIGFKPKTKYLPWRAISKVEAVGKKEALCIAVDSKDSLYVTEHCVLTHNTPEGLGFLALRPDALPALVVCPANVRVNWVKEAAKFTNYKCLIIAAKTLIKPLSKLKLEVDGKIVEFEVSDRPKPGFDITIINYNLLTCDTLKSWMGELLKGNAETQAAAVKEITLCGQRAMPVLQKELTKHKDMETLNRISRAVGAIEKLGDKARSPKAPPHTKAFVNGIVVDDFIEMGQFKTMIADESHYLMESRSQRSLCARKISTRVKNVIGLTGTPVLNKPMELWSQVYIINSRIFPEFLTYGKEFCGATNNGFGWRFTGASNLEKLEKILRSTIMIRRMKTQVLKELPPKTRVTFPVAIESKMAQYEKEAKEPLAELARLHKEREDWKTLMGSMSSSERKKYLAEHAEQAMEAGKLTNELFNGIEKLKQLAVNIKFKECLDFVIDSHQQEGKILVFVTHHQTTDRLMKALTEEKIKADYIDGRVNGADREVVKERFQSGDLEILICGIRAASEGLTLTASHTVIMFEFDWNPGKMHQAEDRTHRITQTMPVTIYYLVAFGTIEEKIVKMIDSKREVANAVLGESDRTLSEDGILDALVSDILGKK